MQDFTHEQIYVALRNDILSRHFALSKFGRSNYFTNINTLGEVPDCDLPAPGMETKTRPCFKFPVVPRRPLPGAADLPQYGFPGANTNYIPPNISEHERWRVWNHDHTNGLSMTGLRLVHLCVDHRLGDSLARKVILSALETIEALCKYPENSDFDGYILRWDPVADDDWELEIDIKGNVQAVLPGRFLLNARGKDADPNHAKYLYCTPLNDPRYKAAYRADGHENWDHWDRFRRWEPSKDEYIGLLAGLGTVYDTFYQSTASEDVEIINRVKALLTRIAKYLQRFGYLMVRPCGGVTMRGPGEIFPLLEMAYNRLFQRTLGTPYGSAPGSYEKGLRQAEILGSEVAAAVPVYALNKLGEVLTGKGMPPVLAGLGGQAQRLAGWLVENMGNIDVLDDEVRMEIPEGYVYASLSRSDREKLFLSWMAGPATEIWSGFKPQIAILFLNDEGLNPADQLFAAAVRAAYISWYESLNVRQSSNPDWYTVGLRSGDYDWGYATAVAMLAAYKQVQTTGGAPLDDLAYQSFVQRTGVLLEQMRKQLVLEQTRPDPDQQPNLFRPLPLTIFGAGCSPMNSQEMSPHPISDSNPNPCPFHEQGPLQLVSEYHDKDGDWVGYLPTLALAWRHLLDLHGSGPNPFERQTDLQLPSPGNWPAESAIVVPGDVLDEAVVNHYRMTLPKAEISTRDPVAQGGPPVPIFTNPPPRTLDDQLGHPPAPRGDVVPFEKSARFPWSYTEPLEWNYPTAASLGLSADQVQMENWTAVAQIDVLESELVQTPPPHFPGIENGRCRTSVTFRPAGIEFRWVAGGGWFGLGRLQVQYRWGRIKGRVHLMWQRF